MSCANAPTIFPKRLSSRLLPREAPEGHLKLARIAQPVFQGVLENATHICNAKFGILFLHEGEFQAAAVRAVPPPYIEYLKRGPHHPGPSGIGHKMVQTRAVIHVLDAREGPAYINRDPSPRRRR